MLRAASAPIALATTIGLACAQAPADGLRLFGAATSNDVRLVDSNSNVVHTWFGFFRPGLSADLESDGTLLRAIDVTTFSAGGAAGGLQRVAFNGTITWDFRYDTGGVLSHHDLEPLPNGNVLIIAWEEKTQGEAIAAGRNPATMTSGVFRPDHVVEVQQTGPTTGTIVWEWHVWDHLVQDFDPTRANFGVVADHPELIDINYPVTVPVNNDWNHCNAVDYDAERDWVLISARHNSEIWIVDHSTTTAEAAGHTGGNHGKGGDLLYRWGNPQAYRAGTPADQQTFGQHDARFVRPGRPGAGNVTMFDNQASTPSNSRVLEIVLPLDANGDFVLGPSGAYGPAAPVWEHSGTFDSNIMSGTERLPNGNQLICAAVTGTVHEVTPSGATVWSHSLGSAIFHARFVEHSLWENVGTISLQAGGTQTLDLLAGSQHAGSPYLVLGSNSGTAPGVIVNGMTLPLNFDGYTVTTASFPNSFPFGGTAGTLDASGAAQARFSMLGGLLPPQAIGLRLDHAFVLFDPTTQAPSYVSNPTPLEFVP